MTRKIAEVTMDLACGGKIVTFFKCKGKKDFHKKMKKKYKDGFFDFGHFSVDDDSIIEATVEFHEVH